MHFRPFSVKIKKNIFFRFRRFLKFFDRFLFVDWLNIGLLPPPPKTPDSPRVPHCRFILKIGKKSEKNRISDADLQKRISDA